MALPPTIPTSFVPHPGGEGARRYRTDLGGAFAFFGYGVLALAIVGALGVFAYSRILAAEQVAKDAALAKAESGIDPHTVDAFVRLQNRLSYGEKLLAGHVALSNFFTLMGTLLPATVRFTDIHITIDDSGVPVLSGDGEAKTFNALAAASDAFAKDGRIKDAIFSKIVVEKNGVVSFAINATLDPALIAYAPQAAGAAAAPDAPSPAAATTTAP